MAKTKYYVEITCQAVGFEKDEFKNQLSEISAALFALEDGAGASVTGDIQRLTVSFGFMIVASNKKTAKNQAVVLARTAVHVAGGSTPGWPESGRVDPGWPDEYQAIGETVHTERELQKAS